MGQTQTSAKPLPKEKRVEREQLKKSTLEQRKNEIDKVQEQFLKNQPNNSLVRAEQISTVVQLTETAKWQLDRGGNNLTKADLIAIILALEPQYRKDYRSIGELTTSDLNAMIRSLIYDPNRLLLDSTSKPVLKSNSQVQRLN